MPNTPVQALEESILAYLRGVRPEGATLQQITDAFSGWEKPAASEVPNIIKGLVGTKAFRLKGKIKALPEWCHGASETHPPTFPHGPVRGTQNELAEAICPGKRIDTRRLHNKAKNTIWIKRLN